MFALVAFAGTSIRSRGACWSDGLPLGETTWIVSSCGPGDASRMATMKHRPCAAGRRATLIWLKTPIALILPSWAVSA